MPAAPPTVRRRVEEAVKELAKAAVRDSLDRPRLPEPAELRVEQRFVEAPPGQSQPSMSSVMREEINIRSAALGQLSGPERQHAADDLRELIDRYRTLSGGSGGSTVEVGVTREKAPASSRLFHAAASRTVGRPVADVLVDTRDREVHHLQRTTEPTAEHIDETVLETIAEGQDKASKLLGQIKTVRKPEEVAALVSDLSALEDAYGSGLLNRPEVGDFAREVKTSIDVELRQKAGSSADVAEVIGGRIGERTTIAEYRVVHHGDVKGAAADMDEVSRDTVSYGEALGRIEVLKDQAAYYALAGDRERSNEKLAELTVVSSSLTGVTPTQTVMVPKKPNEILNAVEQAEGVDARGALKVISNMDKLASEAREAGIENADVSRVYAVAVRNMAQKSQLGQKTSISSMLDDPAERQRILQAMGQGVKHE
jgi:hypothetical protein